MSIHNKKGYTLLEILVVLVIVSILLLVALPNMTGFVETSKSKNADSIAATIYTFADNLLYDDIYITKNNTYSCKESCVIDSSSTSLSASQQALVDGVREAYPDYKGRFYLVYSKETGLLVEYFYADNNDPYESDGKYPQTLSYTPSPVTNVTTRPVANGTYPKPGTTTTTAVTTTTATITTVFTTLSTTATTIKNDQKTFTYNGWNILFWLWYWTRDMQKGDIVVYNGVSYQLLNNRFLVGLPPYDKTNWKKL